MHSKELSVYLEQFNNLSANSNEALTCLNNLNRSRKNCSKTYGRIDRTIFITTRARTN